VHSGLTFFGKESSPIHGAKNEQTFEGHLNSVLHLEFLSSGTQLASSGSDGLVKVWSVKDGECAITLDNHEDKVSGVLEMKLLFMIY
jgi:WD40 repeat protein